MVGTTLGHYEVIAKLGEGGMGVVYEARDRRLDRRVALKILPPAKMSDPARKQRFIQEAKAASRNRRGRQFASPQSRACWCKADLARRLPDILDKYREQNRPRA